MNKIITILITFLALNTHLYADNMEMTDTDGKSYQVEGTKDTLKIEGMEGKVVFMEFFGLSCPACRQEMPHLINLQDKYPQKVKVLAVEVQNNDIDPINAYKKEHGINYTTFSNYDMGFIVRFIADKSSWDGKIPFMVAIDTQGNVQFTQAGLISETELEEYVEKFSR